jgi:hypothetical protein
MEAIEAQAACEEESENSRPNATSHRPVLPNLASDVLALLITSCTRLIVYYTAKLKAVTHVTPKLDFIQFDLSTRTYLDCSMFCLKLLKINLRHTEIVCSKCV